MKVLKILSRRSALAKIQAKCVGEALASINSDLSIDYFASDAKADKEKNMSLANAGITGVFTKDISKKIIKREFDIAVHSWKDLPLDPSNETEIAGTLDRGDLRDILVVKEETSKMAGKKSLKILTSSPRRRYNLGKILNELIPISFKNLDFVDVRGNIETRLQKFCSTDSDVIVLAKVAIDRILEYGNKSSKKFVREILKNNKWLIMPLSVFPTAPGQGAIAIEIRKDRFDLKKDIEKINNHKNFSDVISEKTTLDGYGGGCQQRIGVSVWNTKNMKISSIVGKTEQNKNFNKYKILKKEHSEYKVPLKTMYPLKNSKKMFSRSRINNSKKISSLENSFVYLSRKNVVDDCKLISDSNILWTSGIECWKYAVKKGLWISGSSDGLGEDQKRNINNFVPKSTKSFKLSNLSSKSKKYELIPTYELIFDRENIKYLKLNEKTYFFWMSPIQFDKAVEIFPSIIDKSHSCGIGRTYDHLLEKLPSSNKPKCFLTYSQWLSFYRKEN